MDRKNRGSDENSFFERSRRANRLNSAFLPSRGEFFPGLSSLPLLLRGWTQWAPCLTLMSECQRLQHRSPEHF